MAEVLDPHVELLNPPAVHSEADNDLITPHKSDLAGASDPSAHAVPADDYAHDKEDSLDAEAAMSATDDAAKDHLLANGTAIEVEPTPTDLGPTDMTANNEVSDVEPTTDFTPASAYDDVTKATEVVERHLGTPQQETTSDLPPAPALSATTEQDESATSEPVVEQSDLAPVASLDEHTPVAASVPTVESDAPVVTPASPVTKPATLEEDVAEAPVTDAPAAPIVIASEPEVDSQDADAETKEAPGTPIPLPVPIEEAEHQPTTSAVEAKDDSEASASANGDAHETASSDITAESADASQLEDNAEPAVSPSQDVIEPAVEEDANVTTAPVEDRTPSPEHASYIIQEVSEPVVEQIVIPTSYEQEPTPTPQPELDASGPVDKDENEDKPEDAHQVDDTIIPATTEKGEESEAAAVTVKNEDELSEVAAESAQEEAEAAAPIAAAEPWKDDETFSPAAADEPKEENKTSPAPVVIADPDTNPTSAAEPEEEDRTQAAAAESAQEECETPATVALVEHKEEDEVPASIAAAEPETHAPPATQDDLKEVDESSDLAAAGSVEEDKPIASEHQAEEVATTAVLKEDDDTSTPAVAAERKEDDETSAAVAIPEETTTAPDTAVEPEEDQTPATAVELAQEEADVLPPAVAAGIEEADKPAVTAEPEETIIAPTPTAVPDEGPTPAVAAEPAQDEDEGKDIAPAIVTVPEEAVKADVSGPASEPKEHSVEEDAAITKPEGEDTTPATIAAVTTTDKDETLTSAPISETVQDNDETSAPVAEPAHEEAETAAPPAVAGAGEVDTIVAPEPILVEHETPAPVSEVPQVVDVVPAPDSEIVQAVEISTTPSEELVEEAVAPTVEAEDPPAPTAQPVVNDAHEVAAVIEETPAVTEDGIPASVVEEHVTLAPEPVADDKSAELIPTYELAQVAAPDEANATPTSQPLAEQEPLTPAAEAVEHIDTTKADDHPAPTAESTEEDLTSASGLAKEDDILTSTVESATVEAEAPATEAAKEAEETLATEEPDSEALAIPADVPAPSEHAADQQEPSDAPTAREVVSSADELPAAETATAKALSEPVDVPVKEQDAFSDTAEPELEATAADQAGATEPQRAASPQLAITATSDADRAASLELAPAVAASEPVVGTDETDHAGLEDEPALTAEVPAAQTPVEQSEPQVETVAARAESPIAPIVKTAPQEAIKEESESISVTEEQSLASAAAPTEFAPEEKTIEAVTTAEALTSTVPLDEEAGTAPEAQDHKSEVAVDAANVVVDHGYTAPPVPDFEPEVEPAVNLAESAVEAAHGSDAVTAEPTTEGELITAQAQASFEEEQVVEPVVVADGEIAADELDSDHPTIPVETTAVNGEEAKDEQAPQGIPVETSLGSVKEDISTTTTKLESIVSVGPESEPITAVDTENTAEDSSELPLLATASQSHRAPTPIADEPEAQLAVPSGTTASSEPISALQDAKDPDAADASKLVPLAPSSTDEAAHVTTDEDAVRTEQLGEVYALPSQDNEVPAATESYSIEPTEPPISTEEPVPPVVTSVTEIPAVEVVVAPSAEFEAPQLAPSEISSESYVTTEASHSLVAGKDDLQSDIPEVPESPRSPVGALSPFDSRSDVSASSHVPVVPSSPQISERGSRELFTASAIPYEGLLTPALSDFDPAVKAASVVPEIGGSPRQTPSPTPSEPSSIDAAQDVSPRDTTPIPDDPASHALTEAAVEEHDDKLPEVTIEEQIAAQVPPVVISLADAPPTQDDVIGVEQDETKTASEFGYIPSELAATEYPPSSQAGDIPSEAADSLSVVAEAADEPEPEAILEPVQILPVTEEPVTHAGASIGSETAPLSVDSAPVTVAEETVAAPVAVGKPSLAPIVVASAPAPVLAAPAADADTTNHVAVADTPGAATPLDQVTPTARSAPSYGDVFHTLQVDAEAHAASSLPATAAVDPSTSHPKLSITNEDGVEHDAPLSPTSDGRARLGSTASRHLPGGWVAQPMATPGEADEVNAAGEISSPTTPRHKAKASCIIC